MSRCVRGISSVEMLVAFSLAVAAMASTIPLFVRHQRLLAESRRERLAIEELANHAERIAALEPTEVEPFLDAVTPSEIARRRLPGATIRFERARGELGERVVLSITWNDTGRREHPLRLAVWLPSAAIRGVATGAEEPQP
jgi:hypothetical protein